MKQILRCFNYKRAGMTLIEMSIVIFLVGLIGLAVSSLYTVLIREQALLIQKIETEQALYESSFYLKTLLSQAINIRTPISASSNTGQISGNFIFSDLKKNSANLNKTFIVAKFERENGGSLFSGDNSSKFSNTLIAYHSGATIDSPGTLLIDLGSGTFELQYPYVSYFEITNITSDPLNNIPISAAISLKMRFFLEPSSNITLNTFSPSPTPPNTSGMRLASYKDIGIDLYILFSNNIIGQGGITEVGNRRIRPDQGLYFFKMISPFYIKN